MSVKRSFVDLVYLEKRLQDWQYYAIEDTWSPHTPGVWVAKFLPPEADESRDYCCISLEIGEYLALFFAPKESGLGWELVEQLAVNTELESVREWLESIDVD